jgi:hypothetical protein
MNTNRNTAYITKLYLSNGTKVTEQLTQAYIDKNIDAWMEELETLATNLVCDGRLNLRDLQRLRTLCSRTGLTLDQAIEAAVELADNFA